MFLEYIMSLTTQAIFLCRKSNISGLPIGAREKDISTNSEEAKSLASLWKNRSYIQSLMCQVLYINYVQTKVLK